MIDRPLNDIDALLDRFRGWLEQARVEARERDDEHPREAPSDEATNQKSDFGLIDLVEEFTALRHELKLQTKSGRGLIDQSESTVAAMRQAIELFRSVEPKEAQAAWSAGKAIAEALGDLDEALARGRREIERIRARLEQDATLALADAIDARFRGQSWIRRLLTADFHRQVRNVVEGGDWLRREMLDAILEGYGLIQARLARVMAAEGIERIPCEGQPVDPERMTVIEVVHDTEESPGTVIEELRSGYTWKGRLLRYAEVRAAASAGPEPHASDVEDDDLGPVEAENEDDSLDEVDIAFEGPANGPFPNN